MCHISHILREPMSTIVLMSKIIDTDNVKISEITMLSKSQALTLYSFSWNVNNGARRVCLCR
jgi:hypothetical protein